jgi:hypothetical protein
MHWIISILFLAGCFQKTDPFTEDFRKRMGATDRLAVMVESAKLAVAVTLLEKVPKEVFYRVEYGEATAIRFYKRHTPLYLSVSDLKEVYRFMQESLQFEKDLFNPATFFNGKRLKKPEIDLEGMAERYALTKPYKNIPKGQKLIFLYGNSREEMRTKAKEVLGELALSIEDVREVIVLAEKRVQAKVIAEKLKSSQIGTVQTLEDFVPTEQEEKILVLKKIKKFLTPKVLSYLVREDREWAQRFLELEVFEPFSEKDLPSSTLSRFTEVNGSLGTVLFVEGDPERIAEIVNSVSQRALIHPRSRS